jgi:hypothetical protein
MPSQLRSDTSRANGAKSNGPKSAETRAISSQNALKHGFTSCHTTVLKCEDLDEFQDAIDKHYVTYHPATDAQESLVDEMISARWRIRRIRIAETQLLDLEMIRNQAAVEKFYTQPDPGTHLAEAVRTLMNHTYSLISRYESRLLRLHAYAFRTLRELQKSDPPQPVYTAPGKPEPDPAHTEPAVEPAPSSDPESKNDQTNPASPSTSRCTPQAHDSASAAKPRIAPIRRYQASAFSAPLTLGRLLRRQ